MHAEKNKWKYRGENVIMFALQSNQANCKPDLSKLSTTVTTQDKAQYKIKPDYKLAH